MIRVVFVFLLSMSWLCTPVHGGAWLREGKTGFLAFTSTTRVPEDLSVLNSDTSAYLEYGATPQITLGADLNYSTIWDGQNLYQDGHALFFLRQAVTRSSRPFGYPQEYVLHHPSCGEYVAIPQTRLQFDQVVIFRTLLGLTKLHLLYLSDLRQMPK